MSSSRPGQVVLLEKVVNPWGMRFNAVCGGIGEGLIWGSLLGPVLGFFEGIFKAPRGKRLRGGFDALQKKGMSRHAPVVAAHFAAASFFKTVIPNAALAWAVSFGLIRMIGTRNLAGGVLGEEEEEEDNDDDDDDKN